MSTSERDEDGPPTVGQGNLDRFSGFADLYDRQRPSPPARLGALLASYSGCVAPEVVDLGSGTGLSSRWAAGWAASVVGVEPNPDMRSQAERASLPNLRYQAGVSHATGLAERSADVVIAVQAMHWMEPEATLAEVARVLRPGGVFAAIDADWPPVSGVAAAEQAWETVHQRIRVLEARLATGEHGANLRRPIRADDPSLADDDLHDPHRNRVIPGGVQSWSKAEHLGRMRASGHFVFTREVLFDEVIAGGGTRFRDLMRSQGSYQGLRRAGLTDEDLGIDIFDDVVDSALAGRDSLAFSWRVRLGIVP